MVGTAEYHVGRKAVSHPKKLVDVTAGGAHDTRAGRQRGQHRGDETMPVKQRQHIQAAIGFSQRQRRDRARKPTYRCWRASAGQSSAATLCPT